MIVSRPIGNETNDLLLGYEREPLLVYDLEGVLILHENAPSSGWTHETLEHFKYHDVAPHGWDAYLGSKERWIGSSEV